MTSRADLFEFLMFAGPGLALGVTVMVVVYLRMSAAARRREPVCGRCGYSAKGVSTFQCPECGVDLREVGIERHGGTKRPFVIAMIAGITVAGVVIVVGAWLAIWW